MATLNANSKKVITRIPVSDEDFLKSLQQTEVKDTYIIKRYLKYSAFVLIVVFCSFLTAVLMAEIIRNSEFRREVLDIVKYNIGAILVAIFGFLGIQILNK